MKRVLFFAVSIAALFTLSYCMKSVSMQSMRPAEITFSSNINKILLVNRTKFDIKGGNILEGLLTGELPGEDQAAAEAALSVFQNTLLNSPRFDVVRHPQIQNGNSITAAFPPAMEWDLVEDLAADSKADAVIAVEIFDTDFIVTQGKKNVKKKVKVNGETVEQDVVEFTATGVADVKIGFRVYDLSSRSIIDEQLFTQTRTWGSSGSTPNAAITQLIHKSEAAKAVSQAAANSYAHKIAPMPIRISREFYTKARKSPGMKVATRMADVNDWSSAIDQWKEIVMIAPPKSAGKAAYNIAIGYEVLGDFDQAKSWAQKAYVEYGNKKAMAYTATLNRRLADEERVRQQMK